ncbi:MAG TPA: bifunctional rhamnulose-1-phosphate aldolase/short-chain dehydrogenase, partial [Pirellulaceae bacterium]
MSGRNREAFRHVDFHWDADRAASMGPLDSLVYRSNRLGADGRITNTGGGNTSAKTKECDPITGREVDVLWVKGSGGDLRTATAASFAALRRDDLERLRDRYLATSPRGAKSAIEDAMVDLYRHCAFVPESRSASIDTPLHAFVPWRHVDHTHPHAILALAACERSEAITREVFGEDVAWTPWMRPGFELAMRLEELWRERPDLPGVVLGQHGLMNGADTSRDCYIRTLELIERAARFIESRDRGAETFGGPRFESLQDASRRDLLVTLLPWIRGQLATQDRLIATVHSDASILQFVNSHDAPRLAELGTSCPDHFLRTKIKPLFVEWDPGCESLVDLREAVRQGLEQYRRDYTDYYQRCRRKDSPPMRDANPTVILIPGVGLVAWGKNKSESRVTAEFYLGAVEVMRGAEAIDQYAALPEQEAFDIEYWRLEEAKLRRMPPEAPMARRITMIVGAGSGIGKATTLRLAQAGSHVVCADVDAMAAERAARDVSNCIGPGIGIAGTAISARGPAIPVHIDVTSRESIRRALADTILAYGGLDHLVVTAGLYVAPDPEGRITDEHWRLTFDVNTLGPYLVADEARSIWADQGLNASMVITTSVNAVVPKKGSIGYDASKAAANHVIRELAIDLAPLVRVNGVAPATVVSGSAMFPRDRVLASLAKYGIAASDSETTDCLRARL